MKMIQEDLDGNITRVTLEGRLDLDGTHKVDSQFAFATTSRQGRYVVDLSGVSFIASIGIRMLIVAGRAQSQRGGKMVLVSPEGMGRTVLETAGVDQLIPIVNDLETARQALAGA